MKKQLWQRYNFPKPKSEASKGKLSLVNNEIYSGIELPNMPFFVRLDGWAFHNLARNIKLKKPFDRWFASSLAETAKEFFSPFDPVLAYIFSDEINLLFLSVKSFKRIEKIDSIFAGLASSCFTTLLQKKNLKAKAVFDCRCIPIEKCDIVRYLVWRQAEAFRNSNNSWAQHLLMKRMNARTAAKKLEGLKTAELRELINNKLGLKKIPKWNERGIALYKVPFKKKGYDPIKKKYVFVERKKIVIDWNLPVFASKQGKAWLAAKLKQAK